MVSRQHVKTIGIAAIVLACVGLLWIAWSAPGRTDATPPAPSDHAAVVDPYEDAALTGRVLDPEGEPVVNGTVMVQRAGVPSSARTTRADDQGRYGFADLPAGRWRLDAAGPDLLSPGPEQVRALVIDIDDETSLEVDLTLRRAVQVSGRVLDGKKGLPGLPIDVHYQAALGVSGELAPYVARRAGATGPDGRFALSIAPGDFYLVVSDRQRGTKKSPEIKLSDGARRSGLVLNFGATGRIEGRVQASGGQPVRAALEATGGDLSRPIRGVTDPRGHFVLKGVPPGTYTVTASAGGFRSASAAVRVAANAVAQHVFTLGLERGIQGKVVDGANKPVPRARVVLNWGAAEATVYCDDAGAFRWRRDGIAAATVRAQAFTAQHAPSGWVSATPDQELILRVTEGGFIAGRVVGPDGDGVSPAAVSVVAMDVPHPNPYKPAELRSTRIGNREGTFQLGPLPPGRYSLRGESQKHSPAVVQDILVSSDHVTANVEIRLSSGGTIRGIVRDAQSAPVPNARVTLWLPKTIMPPRIAIAGRDGSYTVAGLPKGRFSLRVQKKGFLTSLSSGIEVDMGEDVERDLVLRKARKGERFSFQGIGATLQRRGGGIAVGNLIDGSPAKAAGLRPGDVILAVDGQRTQRKGIREVVEWIRGEPDSTVTLEVTRGGQPMHIEITRGNVVMK